MLPIIAADGSLRCKNCARPVGRVSEPGDIVPIEVEVQDSPSDPTGALVAVIAVISILFVPILIDLFLLPIPVCWYLDYNGKRNKRRDSDVTSGTLGGVVPC